MKLPDDISQWSLHSNKVLKNYEILIRLKSGNCDKKVKSMKQKIILKKYSKMEIMR